MKWYVVYSLESPHRGDSKEYTQHTTIVQKVEKTSLNYRHLLPDLAPLFTLNDSNDPCLEQNSMVPTMFEQLKFECRLFTRSYGVIGKLTSLIPPGLLGTSWAFQKIPTSEVYSLILA